MVFLVGLGVGVGLILGQAVGAPLAHIMRHEDTLTETITGQVRDVLKRAIPSGLARHLS
jgi:hypothetical protein